MSNIYNESILQSFIGKSIESVDSKEGVIVLTDGTCIELLDTDDCCSGFGWDLKTVFTGRLSENAITGIAEEVILDPDDDPDEERRKSEFIIHILAADKELVAIDVSGQEGTGYYFQGINFRISL